MPKIVHPYGALTFALNPNLFENAMPDDQIVIFLERPTVIYRKCEVVVIPGRASREPLDQALCDGVVLPRPEYESVER